MRNLICLFAISLFILTACKDKKNSGADDRVTVISVDLKKSEQVAMKDIISRSLQPTDMKQTICSGNHIKTSFWSTWAPRKMTN